MTMKKLFFLLLSCLLLFSALSARALSPAAESEQADWAEPVSLRVGSRSCRSDLQPGNEVCAKLLASAPVTLSAEQPFTRLYLRWSVPPVAYTLRSDALTLSCGSEHYLHELITLPEPCTSVTLSLEEDAEPLVLLESALFTDGLLPSWVQDWQPPLEQADLMVLSTHNDDDIIFFGGAEPYYAAERGMKVQVVYFTDQIAQFPRMNECLDALWYMGIRHYPVMGIFKDFKGGNQESYYDFIPPAEGRAYLAENIRRFRPEVLLTQDVNGEYGHQEHIYMVSLLREVLEETADAGKYPESAARYGVWDIPKSYIHLWGDAETQTVMDWDVPLFSFGGLSGIEVAKNAYMHHASQYAKGNHPVEERSGRYSSYRFGLYRSLVGEDEAKNDLFEHLSID